MAPPTHGPTHSRLQSFLTKLSLAMREVPVEEFLDEIYSVNENKGNRTHSDHTHKKLGEGLTLMGRG